MRSDDGQDQLVLEHIGLVYWVAHRFARKSDLDLDDLVSAGTLGLMSAAASYRPELSKFPTYAVPRITGAIQDWYRSLDVLSRNQRQMVKDGKMAAPSYVELGDLAGSTPDCFDRVAAKVDIERALGVLSPRSRRCVIDYHWEGYRLWEIAEQIGVTETRVCQLISEAKQQMRESVKEK